MTFQEYINQKDPKKRFCVQVTEADCEHIDDEGREYRQIITLRILGERFRYILFNSGYLWTIDQNGDPDDISCFIWKGKKLDYSL